MFLAWNEIKHSKLRYGLIVGVMFLIAYLVFFLTGLAYGLSEDFKMAVDKWEADGIVLSEEANGNLNMSSLSIQTLDDVQAKEKAAFAQTAGIIKREHGDKEKVDVNFFGIDSAGFLMPNIVEGRAFKSENEAVADITLKTEDGVKLNEIVKLAGSEREVKIVGFTENARYVVTPVLYVSISEFQQIRFGQELPDDQAKINGIVVRGKDDSTLGVKTDNKELSVYDISTFINSLSGYSAQVLTFGFMISFLIVIGAIVIGIFIYVLTLQKTSIFGVMKAQGISSKYISVSVIAQTFILAVIGIFSGLLASIGTSLVLPAAVPFEVNGLFFGGIAGAMLIVAVLGALFSVRTIVKVDPLKAIG
ncbi:ABC transporter permease [Enterococcus sp. LJL51]|uniref:ABC transporter permease n=1 Tax=Enterococcus sp. LJL51 TaxID=3416656 RepID=UPI003CE8FCA7